MTDEVAMPEVSFVEAAQGLVARSAFSPSAARGQRSGVIGAARSYCSELDLHRFGTQDRLAFESALDRETATLQKQLPHGARRWGLSRKLLNMFLRDSLYTSYLRRTYKLYLAERFYEVPLDSITGGRIYALVDGLPKWPGVKGLTDGTSKAYQKSAAGLAARKGVARVHLDAYFFGIRRDGESK